MSPAYDQRNIKPARRLRANMTPWERKLWYGHLRGRPEHFRRQKPIGGYIVDFSCEQAKLVIELDGGGHYHADQHERDVARDADLTALGMLVLRFSNRDVDRNFEGVCAVIDAAVEQRMRQ
ncbi:endonuclease [Bifidobacterium sp. DSM 109958]|uniref:Endonuclease n=1 Tax=Bifidobacterium moraviense TaxID=2675323 RepID=A0A7Y0F065_9BIFI|nr:endonuclease domain-containing protein [Bifidobacterium sp. DSM 109958]NMM99629.1 endonuclease [Bifidobacterium sp. DSM 109958]